MFKDFLLVGTGSFLGGGMRLLVSRLLAAWVPTPFPLGTFTVNVLGCLLIGFFSGQPVGSGHLSPAARLLLTTGFCGGFTTFSTFMSEHTALVKDGQYFYLAFYLLGSLALGLVAVLEGHQLAKLV